jgi:hypothetical protein
MQLEVGPELVDLGEHPEVLVVEARCLEQHALMLRAL